METPLTPPRVTTVGEFDISTALYSGRLETRVFSNLDSVPESLAKLVQTAEYAGLDKIYPSSLTNDPAVESYGFVDARNVHDLVQEIVQEFVNTHTRTVAYVHNDAGSHRNR